MIFLILRGIFAILIAVAFVYALMTTIQIAHRRYVSIPGKLKGDDNERS